VLILYPQWQGKAERRKQDLLTLLRRAFYDFGWQRDSLTGLRQSAFKRRNKMRENWRRERISAPSLLFRFHLLFRVVHKKKQDEKQSEQVYHSANQEACGFIHWFLASSVLHDERLEEIRVAAYPFDFICFFA
jgi:hypothetical protein